MMQYKDLMADDHDEEAGDDEKSAGLVRQKRMLEEGRRNLGLATEYSTNIGSELNRQKEKLQKSLSTVERDNGDERDHCGPGHVDLAAGLAGSDPQEEPAGLLRGVRLRRDGDSILRAALTVSCLYSLACFAKKNGPYEARTHDLGVISSTL